MDWKKLVELAAPAAAGLASHGNQAGVLRGFMAEQERIAQERQVAAQRSQQHKAQGAAMSFELLNRLQQETDPVRFQQLRDTITTHADAYGIDPAEFASMPLPDGSDAKLKELSGILSGLEKVYDLDQLAETGASVSLKDGSHIPVADAVRLTRVRPLDGSGNPIAAPKKADVQASTDYGRFLARYAKDKGKKVDDLTAADELDAKAQFGRSDDALKAGPTDYTSRYLDNLVALWKESHPGQEPPASVTNALMRQAKKEVGQADDKPTSDQLVQVTEVDPETGELVTKLVPKVAGEVGRRPATKKDPTQGEYTTAGYAGRIEQAESILQTVEQDIAGMGVMSYAAQSRLPAAAQSAVFQSYDQASRNFINAVLRRESGAAIAPSEFDSARKQYLPQPGDAPATLRQKKANRDLVFANLKRASGGAYQPPVTPTTPDASGAETWVRDASGKLVRKAAN